ncbi:MAG: hypothetical protein J5849_04360 [Clostridia bacterium]|nr:hypothetical protein [Clostridia bacterium]
MKRIIAAVLSIAVVFSLCACMKRTNAPAYENKASLKESEIAAPITPEDFYQTETETSDPVSDTTERNEENDSSEPDSILDPADTAAVSEAYELARNDDYDRFSLKSRGFKNGVAWACFTKSGDGKKEIGLINEAGEILYILDQNRLSLTNTKICSFITTPFVNGLSCVYAYENGNAAYSLPGFIIVNQKGEEVYTCFDENVYVCGQASNGNILLLKNESGFDGERWLFYTLDTSLKLTDTGILGSEKGYDRAQSESLITIADGIYYLHGYLLFIDSGARFRPTQQETNYDYIGKSTDYACFALGNNYYLVPFDVLKTATSETELCALMKTNSRCVKINATNENKFNNYGFTFWRHGTAYDSESRWYTDLDTGKCIAYPSFHEGIYYFRIDSFRGGYAALYLVGADQNGYVTIIDESGNILYDPVRCKAFNTYTGGDSLEATSFNGYIFSSYFSDDKWRMQITDRSGEHRTLGDDLTELAGEFYHYDFSFSINIGEKYIWVSGASFDFKDEYVSLDGKATIKKLTANYNADGKLISAGTGN